MTTVESLVVDAAVVGAGLGGLALARVLHAQDVSVVVIEAREGDRADAMLRIHRPDAGPRSGLVLARCGAAHHRAARRTRTRYAELAAARPRRCALAHDRTANRSGARGRLGRMPGRAASQAGRRAWSIRRLQRFRQPACGPATRC
ncbi:NAD(P)-binding protein [Paraburkholderia dilworthii]|uniref:NAD(P)-binding protein n=1 Tax=Paraburkholderia dilworthii TaxID=948106 RepID=UPI0012694F14